MSGTMEKHIQIVMPDKSLWQIPAKIVAQNRAKYYADKEGLNSATYDQTYTAEYNETLRDHAELLDWAANNMNWCDVARSATMLCAGTVDYQEGWVNGSKRVVEELTENNK